MQTDQHTATKAKPSAFKDPWAQVRRAIFQRINVRTPSGTRSMTRLAAYLEHLTASSAQGDLSSGRELRYIMYFLDDNKILHEPKHLSDDSLNMKKEFDYYQKISDSPIKARSMIYILTYGEIESRYTKVYGELGSHQVITPRYIDLDVCKPYMKRLRRASSPPAGTLLTSTTCCYLLRTASVQAWQRPQHVGVGRKMQHQALAPRPE